MRNTPRKTGKIEVDLGVRFCKHIVLPSPFCESLPDKLLDGAEIKKNGKGTRWTLATGRLNAS
jgi:hypothetical protein